MNSIPRIVLALVGLTTGLIVSQLSLANAQQDAANKPVKVAEAKIGETTEKATHPLDPAIKLAQQGQVRCNNEIKGYSATLVRRERVGGKLTPHEYIFTKVTNRQSKDGQVVTPFRCYLYFLKPTAVKGREIVYIEGQNNGKFCVHEGSGAKSSLPDLWLDPLGPLAMQGQRYPITFFGIQNLIDQMIERAVEDTKHGECTVQFRKGATINGRKCTLIQVIHPKRRPHFDFHVAQIFMDDEYKLPIRYAAYDWPAAEGQRPALLEEYTYLNVELNPGHTDSDFLPSNETYNFKSK